jgi:hypothetical protein
MTKQFDLVVNLRLLGIRKDGTNRGWLRRLMLRLRVTSSFLFYDVLAFALIFLCC